MPESDLPPSPAAQRTFWQRRVSDPLVRQLTQGITAEKLALTFAVGGAVALFPILGTTTLLCFLVGFGLRLNQPILQLLNQALWPVHVTVAFWCVRLGEKLYDEPPVDLRFMRQLLRRDHIGVFLHHFGMTALHAIVVWAILAPFFVIIVYYVALPLLRGISRIKTDEEKVKAASQTPFP